MSLLTAEEAAPDSKIQPARKRKSYPDADGTKKRQKIPPPSLRRSSRVGRGQRNIRRDLYYEENTAAITKLKDIFPFLQLPRELRDEIYHWMWVGTVFKYRYSNLLANIGYSPDAYNPDAYKSRRLSVTRKFHRQKPALPIWLQLSRQILKEGMEQFYRVAKFQAYWTSWPVLKKMKFSKMLTLDKVQKIDLPPTTLLALHCERLGLYRAPVLRTSPTVHRPIQDLIKGTISLKEITLRFGFQPVVCRDLSVHKEEQSLFDFDRVPTGLSRVTVGIGFGEWVGCPASVNPDTKRNRSILLRATGEKDASIYGLGSHEESTLEVTLWGIYSGGAKSQRLGFGSPIHVFHQCFSGNNAVETGAMSSSAPISNFITNLSPRNLDQGFSHLALSDCDKPVGRVSAGSDGGTVPLISDPNQVHTPTAPANQSTGAGKGQLHLCRIEGFEAFSRYMEMRGDATFLQRKTTGYTKILLGSNAGFYSSKFLQTPAKPHFRRFSDEIPNPLPTSDITPRRSKNYIHYTWLHKTPSQPPVTIESPATEKQNTTRPTHNASQQADDP
ncbi:uncharacterized protein BDR25DRAFT_358932 [Lindgomyces ingoldianus]|uniref:Uncharacterized protein n=1 Tax=Lindgomyces ingoldianus TaxID=673940 RepID=A0ACB6QJ15_9PLEO|nr:uncharacterized protein BDR25DRAFT_358932 [Lindgomyces ingoldianus]KAF2466871.1 hypothetical protein BDR25DRAFT_358932 [Lindgomyces ingoldianus]